MNDSNEIAKSVIVAVVTAIVMGAIFLVFAPKGTNTIEQVAASPAGTTFGTAKLAAINISPATSAASSTSMLNTDAGTRIILDSFVSCNGALGQGGSFQAATTTLANLGFGGNTNFIASTTASTTASSANFFVASSTEGVLPYISRVWPSGTYLTFDAINNSYNGLQLTACTVGVHYLQS